MASAVTKHACGKCYPNGADVNYVDKHGKSLLMGAAERGHVQCAQRLIEKGANVNAADHIGDTALIRAIETRKTKCVQLLM